MQYVIDRDQLSAAGAANLCQVDAQYSEEYTLRRTIRRKTAMSGEATMLVDWVVDILLAWW